MYLCIIWQKFVCGQRASVCGQRWLCAKVGLAVRHERRAAIVLHDVGDVSDWRSLAGVVEICCPVNNPPRRTITLA